ncbi:tollo [Carabus blaptoides fortunei]
MEHRQMFWLLLLVLLQPAFTQAACSFNTQRKHIKCTLSSLHMGVPLTTYMTSYVSEATKALSIEFSSSTINTVPVGVFHIFNTVKTLTMNNVSINSISPGAFSGMTQLQDLYLNFNNISELQASTFDGLVQLKSLYMSENKLTTLKSLNGLTKLESLYLNKNNIKTIDDGAFKDTVKLKQLQMSGNQLFGVFTGLTSLKTLDVSNNKIARLESKVLFPVKSLTHLKLDGNLLRSFDANTMASHLTTLKSISLDRNQMQCEWLTSCIYVFTFRNITVLPGGSFKTSNVHGIYCVDENEPGNVTIPTAVPSSTTRKPSTTQLSVTTVDERAGVSTFNVEHASTTPYFSAEVKISKALLTEHEKTNDLGNHSDCNNSGNFVVQYVFDQANYYEGKEEEIHVWLCGRTVTYNRLTFHIYQIINHV